MVAPVFTEVGSGTLKSSSTSTTLTLTSTSFTVGDYIVVGFATDPVTGAITYQNVGPNTSSWTTIEDVTNGSGSTGVRITLAYALLTASGSMTSVQVTHPTATPKAGLVFRCTGAHQTTPVVAHSGAASNTAIGISPPTSNMDIAFLAFVGMELPNTAGTLFGTPTASSGLNATWTTVFRDASATGTSGGSQASNISCCSGVATASDTVSTKTYFWSQSTGSSTQDAVINTMWQSVPSTGIAQWGYVPI